MLSYIHITSIVLTLLAVTLLGVYSVKKVSTASDFAVGGKSVGVPLLVGTIVGTIAGGASTVGTAQLAYTHGMSAWWFTLGAGIALVLLGLFMAKPLRESEATTVPELLGEAYGKKAIPPASIFSSIGIFLNIVGQILSAVAIFTAIFSMSPFFAAVLSVLLVIFYVIFGGVWGTGMVGILKTVLIYGSMLIMGVLALQNAGGFSGYTSNLPFFPNFSLFGRGFAVDLAAGFSLVVGVVSTQTYLQAMFSGKTYKESKKGAIISGLLMPPLGVGGILVGLYMKMNYPGIVPKEALPLFILTYLPDWLGGIIFATLIISVVGTGAGLVLGIATMLSRDIYKGIFRKGADDQQVLFFSRLSIVVVTGLTLVFTVGNMDSLILQWSFLSMGLRGATICFPLLGALFFRSIIRPKAAILAIGVAPAASILWAVFLPGLLDPLYIGLVLSAVIITAGSFGYTETKEVAN